MMQAKQGKTEQLVSLASQALVIVKLRRVVSYAAPLNIVVFHLILYF